MMIELNDYAKDIKLNLSTLLTEEGAAPLTQKQIYLIALASAYTTKQQYLIDKILTDGNETLTEKDIFAAKAAATLMAMNNVYYRFTHLVSDKSFLSLPAKLRMNIMANPSIEKTDFELLSLAISAINGCGLCMDSHTKVLMTAGLSHDAIQASVKIAAVINAAALALTIDGK